MFRLFLLGLAIPAQAVIVPMFYVISKAGLYDNLIGVILPTAAFCLPVCALILTGAMRDITPELYEAMAMDGAAAAAGVLPAGGAAVQGRPLHDRGLLRAAGVERLPLPAGPDPVRLAPR